MSETHPTPKKKGPVLASVAEARRAIEHVYAGRSMFDPAKYQHDAAGVSPDAERSGSISFDRNEVVSKLKSLRDNLCFDGESARSAEKLCREEIDQLITHLSNFGH